MAHVFRESTAEEVDSEAMWTWVRAAGVSREDLLKALDAERAASHADLAIARSRHPASDRDAMKRKRRIRNWLATRFMRRRWGGEARTK